VADLRAESLARVLEPLISTHSERHMTIEPMADTIRPQTMAIEPPEGKTRESLLVSF
jgi:hypothetical protein